MLVIKKLGSASSSGNALCGYEMCEVSDETLLQLHIQGKKNENQMHATSKKMTTTTISIIVLPIFDWSTLVVMFYADYIELCHCKNEE